MANGIINSGTSVSGVLTNTDEQEKLRQQMAQNSQAWHTADENTRRQLEQANKELAAQLGGLSFNSENGTWSGTAGGTAAGGTDKPAVSTQGVIAGTPERESILQQMAGNSQAWHTADEETRRQLEQANRELAARLGGLTFDPVSGTWSGTAGGGSTSGSQLLQVPELNYTAPEIPAGLGEGSGVEVPSMQLQNQPIDQSAYIEEMYRAKREAALAELRAAYEQNMNAVERAGEGVGEAYQAARRQTAGASEQARRNFAEQAAARGLNSGAGGQAELARSVALQNDLAGINREEAQTLADLELQRANAESEFNLAIAQAQAEGNYQLAQALYQEKIRVESALREQELNQLQLNAQKYALQYQAERDKKGDQLNLWNLQYQTGRDQVADELQKYALQYQQERDRAGDQQWQQQFEAANQQWQDSFEFEKQQYLDALAQLQGTNTGGGTGGGSVSGGSYTGGSTGGTGYNNGSLSAEQVKELQAAFGLAADGYWGPNSQSTTGMTADEAWAQYQVESATTAEPAGEAISDIGFRQAMRSITTAIDSKQDAQAQRSLDSLWPRLNEAQRAQLQNTLLGMGIEYTPGG